MHEPIRGNQTDQIGIENFENNKAYEKEMVVSMFSDSKAHLESESKIKNYGWGIILSVILLSVQWMKKST